MHDKVALPIGNGNVAEVEMMPLHPHNNPIQIWLELGIPGALIAAFLIVLMLRRLSAPDIDPGVRAVALAASTVHGCLSCTPTTARGFGQVTTSARALGRGAACLSLELGLCGVLF